VHTGTIDDDDVERKTQLCLIEFSWLPPTLYMKCTNLSIFFGSFRNLTWDPDIFATNFVWDLSDCGFLKTGSHMSLLSGSKGFQIL
jgi:hypothetical protein